jgi:hypothetical protein
MESGTETETDIGETKVAQICAVIWKDLSELILSLSFGVHGQTSFIFEP